jgi:hypothetical protein
MSFRDTPITKNCEVIDVMGRRIATSTARKASVGQETVIDNWQPFQIRGGRVTPARVTTGTTFYETGPVFMPTINGLPMDHPSARLNGTGDVYLNATFDLVQVLGEGAGGYDQYYFVLAETPTISFNKVASAPITCNRSYSTGARSIGGQPKASWKLGTIGSPTKTSFRYFNGYKHQIDFWEEQNGFFEGNPRPIYGKRIEVDPEEKVWPTVALNVQILHYFEVVNYELYPNLNDYEYEFTASGALYGELSNFSGAAYAGVISNTGGIDYGDNTGGATFYTSLFTTLAAETPLL